MELRKLLAEQLRLSRVAASEDEEFTREDGFHLAEISLQLGEWLEQSQLLPLGEVQPGAEPLHPIQPVVFDPDGIARFKKNRIIRYLVNYLRDQKLLTLQDLVELPDTDFREQDWEQFYQLIGYSVSGYGDVFPDSPIVGEADRAVESLQTTRPPA